jgi:hypothetical protein
VIRPHASIRGYDGPTGAFIATRDGILPLSDPRALAALLASMGIVRP